MGVMVGMGFGSGPGPARASALMASSHKGGTGTLGAAAERVGCGPTWVIVTGRAEAEMKAVYPATKHRGHGTKGGARALLSGS